MPGSHEEVESALPGDIATDGTTAGAAAVTTAGAAFGAGVEAAVDAAVAAGIPGVVAGLTTFSDTLLVRTAGVRSIETGAAATSDTVFALFSATKAITATAALQCVEEGLIDLDRPARDYLPEIGELRVLERLAEDGAVTTRPPRTEITPRMLLLHTSGLAYDMFDERYARLARDRMKRPPSATPQWDALHTPLLHDPGERWTYGTSLDWLGLLVAKVRGERLEDVMRARIFEPCGMPDTSFDVRPDMRDRLATVHRRTRDGSIVAAKGTPPDRPELDLGGQGLFSTVPDYLAFLRVWLGDGAAPGGRVLRASTVAWASRAAPGLEVTALAGAIPALTHPAEFFPGASKSWAYSFLVNDADVPGRRRAGSLAWAGLGNVYYWIDRASGIAGIWSAQLLPFFDPDTAAAFEAFERAAYSGLSATPASV